MSALARILVDRRRRDRDVRQVRNMIAETKREILENSTRLIRCAPEKAILERRLARLVDELRAAKSAKGRT